MIPKPHSSFLLILSFLISTYSLHLQQTTNSQLIALKQKQQLVRDQVKSLNDYSNNINKQLETANSDKEKVDILQNALKDQKESVFNLKNKIIYPFNQSETACQQLTETQKTLYRQKIAKTKTQIAKLEEVNNKLNQASPQVQYLKDEIQKEYILLQTMEDILNVKCKQNLTPTIFQSNLKAKNWVLGPQTMKDLKEEYAQRAFLFHNITNCPLQTPFFDPVSQTCIVCEAPEPVWNMLSKQCDHCEQDEELDNDKRVCKSKPHYTNFTKVSNWNLDGGSLPEIDKNLTECSDDKPYFNGVICIPCTIPFYWSVSANLCKKCETGYEFDMNTKNCEKIIKHELTILQTTKWVSENLTKVLETRAQVLEKNKTSKNYQYCGSKESPYYDGTTCIACEYFDIDQKKCVSKPDGTEYDQNMRQFVAPETKKQTNPTATRYISSNKLTDTDLSNCNSSFPYYDGIACIQCLKPFDIFNVDQKRCISCDSDQIYVQASHTCQKRQQITISQNFDRLLATPSVTVPQFKESIIKKINENPEAIISPCPQKNQYSNFTHCFPCQDNQYFNVETLNCVVCDGVYFDNNQTCKAKVYIFTNLKAPKIVDMDGTTVDDENNKISEFIKTHPESSVCPIEKPYAIDNTTCGTCTDLFSYTDLKCKSCPEFFIYVADSRKCAQATMLVNFTDAHRTLVSESQTLISFKEQQQKVKNDNPNTWKICPGDRPFTSKRDSCFDCTGDTPYFNYTAKQCQNCPDHYIFDPVTVRCTQQFFITLINSDTQPKMLGYDNYTLANFKSDQDTYKKNHPTTDCDASQPYGTVTGCQQCNEPTPYFDIKRKECSDAKYLINFQKISPNYIVTKDKKLDQYMVDEENFRKEATTLTKKCADATPYTNNDRGSCFNCQSDEYFSFVERQCVKCQDGQAYSSKDKLCETVFYVTKINNVTELKMKGYQNYTMDSYKADQADIKAKNPFQQCSDNTPYATNNGCEQCQDPTPYFDIKKKICSSAKNYIRFSSIGNNYILGDGKNLSSYQQDESQFKTWSEDLTAECPSDAPFPDMNVDRRSCFACKDPEVLYNFETKKCEACSVGATFSTDKKKCLRLFYITNFNTDSQKKMVESSDYSITSFKADEDKRKKQNPYKDCPTTEPYGSIDGCKKCIVPEEYFDIKNRKCTAVKKMINFDSVGNNYLLKDGKALADYQRDQQNDASSSGLPTINCAASTPFTSNRDECFSCQTGQPYFNFETKSCEGCGENEAFDPNAKKCIKKQFYTLFSSSTESNLLESEGYTFDQYKKDQLAVKGQTGSSECPSTKPYAGSAGCVKCDSSNPYFNIKSQTCQNCDSGKKYFESSHQCLTPAYMTDFTNSNLKQADGYTLDDAKKAQNDRASSAGYGQVKCTNAKPYATLDGCVSCDDAKLPYFNVKTLQCDSCTEYEYFKDHKCNKNVMLTNTEEMIGYQEADNYTKYNVEKMNNFTYISSPSTTKFCPKEAPFFSIDNVCVACNSTDAPVFHLKDKKCIQVDSIQLSNPEFMKFYIEKGDETMAELKNEIDVLKGKGVNVVLCPQDKPYFSHNECQTCPLSTKYFDLATEMCKRCDAGEKCIDA